MWTLVGIVILIDSTVVLFLIVGFVPFNFILGIDVGSEHSYRRLINFVLLTYETCCLLSEVAFVQLYEFLWVTILREIFLNICALPCYAVCTVVLWHSVSIILAAAACTQLVFYLPLIIVFITEIFQDLYNNVCNVIIFCILSEIGFASNSLLRGMLCVNCWCRIIVIAKTLIHLFRSGTILILLLVLLLLFLLLRPLQKKSLRLRGCKSDQDEIWQDCSPSKCTSIDGWHLTFKMAAMTLFHEKA